MHIKRALSNFVYLPKLKCGGVKSWSHDWLLAAGAYPDFYRHEADDIIASIVRTTVRFPKHRYPFILLGEERHSESCLAQEHNAMSPVRARTRTAPLRSRAH